MTRKLTPEEHDRDRAEAEHLIQAGDVRNWRELGQRFGITAQAARQRFGNMYGVDMPARVRRYTCAVSVALQPATYDLVESVRGRRSAASVVREVVERHLEADVKAGHFPSPVDAGVNVKKLRGEA